MTFSSLAAARSARSGLAEPAEDASVAQRQAFEDRDAALDSRIGNLESTWSAQVEQAGSIRGRVFEAARRAGEQIRAAGRTSPTATQSWLDDRREKTGRWVRARVGDLRGLLAEHAGLFRFLAEAMRVVGAALAVLGLVLAAVELFLGPIGVGGGDFPALLIGFGFGLYGGADVLDSTVDWAEGRISGQASFKRPAVSMAAPTEGESAYSCVCAALASGSRT